ncbi:MAG TPA: FAD-dependent monooxygenase [Geminicoccus sp.]|uniref:NAD(P)/FAD-dependent oxidoreductase n=1 Tax=Geminicoccus sp. TaxID=2024832 RepID=UPI002E301BC1|nr:FAD-dependent monooxygenase [Geminicoccus sp.]HEX2526140.1 FAD-dependent monooxygenase [Geminicoccus sp.]
MTRLHDALVIGGGPAGSALAQALARAGRDVVLVEREAGPHDKVCGEFLSHEAVHYLRDLGVQPERLGAVPIDEVGFSAAKGMARCRLPFPAWSLSRRRMDEALIERARAAGAVVRRGLAVRQLDRGGHWIAQLADGSPVSARDAFIGTGKHDLRGWKRGPGRQNDLIGLKMHVRLAAGQAARLGRRVELFLFPGGYGGLEPIEEGAANICLLVRKQAFQQFGQGWEALLDHVGRANPHLGERLAGASSMHDRPLAIAGIPYGLVQQPDDGCWRLGDQAAVIPSFAGEGMSIALHSACLAADYHLRGRTSAAFHHRMRADVAARVGGATLLSRLLVQAWPQAVLGHAARLCPGALAAVAALTRIPDRALRRLPLSMVAGGAGS